MDILETIFLLLALMVALAGIRLNSYLIYEYSYNQENHRKNMTWYTLWVWLTSLIVMIIIAEIFSGFGISLCLNNSIN